MSTLLIVEDHELNRELLVQIFEDAYDLALADDAPTAIAMAAARRPDLILMDIGLPGMDGLAAVRWIRRWTATPIVAVSARVMPRDRELALEAGCDAFVTKPVDEERLVPLVERLTQR